MDYQEEDNVSSDEEPKYLYERGPYELRQDYVPTIPPFRTAKYKLMKSVERSIDQELKAMWRILFIKQKDRNQNDQDEEVSLMDVLPIKHKKTEKTALCNKYFDKKELSYVCYDCGYYPYSFYCAQCFHESEHRGHRYQSRQKRGGMCCCGNKQAVKSSGFCPRHTGELNIPKIQKEERQQFMKIFCTLFEWYLKMRERDDREPIMLLNHMFHVLFCYNDQSVYYNILTYQWLFWECSNRKTMLRNIFEIGTYNLDTCLAKLSTLVLLQLYGIQQFKEKLLVQFIDAWNTIKRFQQSSFRTLFLHLYLDAELMKKIIPTLKKPLNPIQKKQRQNGMYFNAEQYFEQISLIQLMGPQVFKTFFRPIIEGDGIDLYLSQQMEDKMQNGVERLQAYIKDKAQIIQSYISMQKQVAMYFQDEPHLIKKQIKRQYKFCKSFRHRNNVVLIPHPRSWAIYILAYFKGDLLKVDPHELMNICEDQQNQFIELLIKNLSVFMQCLRQFAFCLANKNFKGCDFDKILPAYVTNQAGIKYFALDCLGIRIIAVLLNKLQKDQIVINYMKDYFDKAKQNAFNQEKWSKNSYDSMIQRRIITLKKQRGEYIPPEPKDKDDLFGLRNMDVEVMMQHMFKDYKPCSPEQLAQQSTKKTNQIHSLYLFQILNYFMLISECVFVERPQIIVAYDCGINNSIVRSTSLKQWKEIFKNVGQIPSADMSKYFNYFFGAKGDIYQVQEIAILDRINRIYTIKQDIKSPPLCKEVLHSFISNPQNQMFSFVKDQITLDKKSSIMKKLFLHEDIVDKFLNNCFEEFQTKIRDNQKNILELFARAIKLIGHVFGFEKDRYKKAKQTVLHYARSLGKENIINSIFTRGDISANRKQERHRQLQLKKRQKEQLQMSIPELEREKKVLASIKESVQKAHIDEGNKCIICQKSDKVCYMGWYGESSNMFNMFGINDTYPFFQTCLHAAHTQCYDRYRDEQNKDTVGNESVDCVSCKLPTNICLPGQDVLNNPQKLRAVHIKLDELNTAQSRTNFAQSFPMYLTKSIVSLFFSIISDRKKSSIKRIVIYKKVVMEMLKKRYNDLLSIERQRMKFYLNNNHLKYENKNHTYHLDQLFGLVNIMIWNSLEQYRIGIKQDVEIDFNICKYLHNNQIERCIGLADIILDINVSNRPKLKKKERRKLAQQQLFFVPPLTLPQLLKFRIPYEKCKSGHNITICVLCRWSGCADCEQIHDHRRDYHPRNTIFFNLITGGFIYVYLDQQHDFFSLYYNDRLGNRWRPSEDPKQYSLDLKLYNDIMNAFIDEDLHNFLNKKIRQRILHKKEKQDEETIHFVN